MPPHRSRIAAAQTADLPKETSTLFSGSGNCAICHVSNGEALRDSLGNDLSLVHDWASTMMANAFKEPLWQARLHLLVSDEAGEKVFESGGSDAGGRIENLASALEPHRDRIDAENQVQIYESRMVDVNGDPTYTLLRGAGYIKDNRIPPAGFVTSAERYADMAIYGEATMPTSIATKKGKEVERTG